MAFLSKVVQATRSVMSVTGAYSEYKSSKNKDTFQRLLFACIVNGNAKQFESAGELVRMFYFERGKSENLDARLNSIRDALSNLEHECEPAVRVDGF